MRKKHQIKLSFIAVGPQRTGSTWLHKVMENHPAIGLPMDIKETMFFDQYHHKGIEWLLSHYNISGENRVFGEVAPTYFASELVLERIKRQYPDCKILINVRNPVQHAYSMYSHELSKGRIKGELVDIIANSPEKLRSGSYSEWIPRWQNAFGTDNVYMVWMDQIENNPQIVYQEVCEFLGVSAEHYLQTVGDNQVNASKQARYPTLTRFGVAAYHLMREYRLHRIINFCKRIGLDKVTFSADKSKAKSRPGPTEFRSLLNLYSEDIDFLEQTTGRDLSSWRSDSRQASGASQSYVTSESMNSAG